MKNRLLITIGLLVLVFTAGYFIFGVYGSHSASKNSDSKPNLFTEANVVYCVVSGVLFVSAKDYQTAIDYYNEAIKLDPKADIAYSGRGCAYFALKRYQNAVDDFSQAIKLNPEDAASYNMRAWINAVQGKYKDALPDACKSIELDREMAESHDTLGYVLFGMGNYNAALQSYNSSIKLNQKDGEVYYHRAQLYEKLDKKDLAEKDYEQAKQLDYVPGTNR